MVFIHDTCGSPPCPDSLRVCSLSPVSPRKPPQNRGFRGLKEQTLSMPHRNGNSPVRRAAIAIAVLATILTWVCPVSANDQLEIEYLLTGLLQEREKLRSGSCEIEGSNQKFGPHRVKYLFREDSFRFTRFAPPPEPGAFHACDNRVNIFLWDGESECSILRSADVERQGLSAWDPRFSGVQLPSSREQSYKNFVALARNAWTTKDVAGLSATVQRSGNQRTIVVLIDHVPMTQRISLTIDVENGFTPVRYLQEEIKKKPPTPEQTVFVRSEVTSEWKRINEVWVPVRHRQTENNGQPYQDYTLTWEWVNREVDDREFALGALGVPPSVKCADVESGRDVGGTDAPPVKVRRFRWLVRGIGVVAGILIVAILLRASRRSNRVATSRPPP